MPKKGWKAPEKRSIRLGINVSKTELDLIDENARRLPAERAIYIREAALAMRVNASPTALTIDKETSSKIVCALNDAGSRVQRLVDILSLGDDPRADHWDNIEQKFEYAIATFLKAIQGQ